MVLDNFVVAVNQQTQESNIYGIAVDRTAQQSVSLHIWFTFKTDFFVVNTLKVKHVEW